jgi:hypothetical protein
MRTIQSSIFWQHRFETVSALGVLLWGVMLLNPTETFTFYGIIYREMAKHASENTWGFGALLIGVLSLAGMAWRVKILRRIGMIGVIAFRTFTLVFVGIQSGFLAPAVVDFCLWAAMALLAYENINDS